MHSHPEPVLARLLPQSQSNDLRGHEACAEGVILSDRGNFRARRYGAVSCLISQMSHDISVASESSSTASLVTAQMGMDSLPRNCTLSAGTPSFPPSVSDLPPRDRGRLHIGDMSELKSANHRTGLRSDPNSRWNHEKSACNLAAHMHGRSEHLPSLPPASRGAWGHDAHRITERIAVWTSSARLSFITALPVQGNPRLRTVGIGDGMLCRS